VDKSDLKRVHKSVQNIVYNEMGLNRGVMDERIEEHINRALNGMNIEKLIADQVFATVQQMVKSPDSKASWTHGFVSLKYFIEEKVASVVREKVSEALKGLEIKL